VFRYLLRKLTIDRPNQVWAADLTYIPMARGFVQYVAAKNMFSARAMRLIDRRFLTD